MAGYYTESNYENAVLQLLNEGLGYTYVYGPDVERDYHSPLYEDVLLPALQRINKGLPLDAINEAIYKLKNFESGSLLQKNMTFTDYLQNGISVKYFVNGEERSTLVYLVDFGAQDGGCLGVVDDHLGLQPCSGFRAQVGGHIGHLSLLAFGVAM